jgi:tripeptidyl-peptidase-1
MIGQLGTRGVSVIFSSGDTGTGSACQSNDGKNTTRFLPTFPAACPYVTSVGGTVNVEPEEAVSFSSGGFSDQWKRPWYQEKQVKDYLTQLGSKWEGLYNQNGRGFPDISAQGANFVVIDGGRSKLISGTSASAPVIAAVVGLLNAQRVQSSQPPLGFLNPWLYQNGANMLTDIVKGGSTGCSGTDQFSGLKAPKVPGATWAAVAGWDPVTGLGTPLFDQMLKLLPTTPLEEHPGSLTGEK